MKPGDKVVRIKKPLDPSSITKFDPRLYKLIGVRPIVGQVYVIDSVFVHPFNGLVGLNLIGSKVVCSATGIEIGWDAREFRKLDELKKEARERQQKEQQNEREQPKPEWQPDTQPD